jgi:hypothetical protein
MTFAKAIKILDLLEHDKEIVVKIKNDWDGFSTVDRFSKYDEISDYIKYFTDNEHDYHFYIVEDDNFCSDEEIKDD